MHDDARCRGIQRQRGIGKAACSIHITTDFKYGALRFALHDGLAERLHAGVNAVQRLPDFSGEGQRQRVVIARRWSEWVKRKDMRIRFDRRIKITKT